MAVLKGWLKETTLNFFLKYIAPQERSASPFIGRQKNISPTWKIPPVAVKVSEKNSEDLAEFIDWEISWQGWHSQREEESHFG
jgi:hypothetical protein